MPVVRAWIFAEFSFFKMVAPVTNCIFGTPYYVDAMTSLTYLLLESNAKKKESIGHELGGGQCDAKYGA